MAYDKMLEGMCKELYDEVETILIQECGEDCTFDKDCNQIWNSTFDKENALDRIKKLFNEKIS